ncbi:hypothetical protein C7212DRAFT_295315 [Tuber magnatum]|uniref:t-SNARE coiled-coil homology domain-containing protein n=1 Tax=Tuber magnatum TaxID=42249 RepID=A0A317SQX4_9PEZI|nr:hypothetical protein C7212DRAFT_295315 [Tuber magnatum]
MEVKSKSKTALGNAIDAATKAEGSASATLASLQAQGERLTSTELNLGTASVQNDIAAEKTHELENYNRSMFVPKKMRFFRSRSRVQDEETTIISRNQAEREERDRTREFGYDSKNVVGRGVDTTRRVESKEKSSVAERPQYQFEPKADDDQIEDEIDAGLDELGAITGRLKGIAIASGKVVDRQNEQINRIIKKSDRVDDQIALNQNRLRKIH